QLHRGRVRPVQVLDRDENRAVVGEPAQQGLDHLERSILQRLGRELDEPGRRILLEREAEQRAEVGVDLAAALAEEPLDFAAQRDANAELRLVAAGAEPLPQQVSERPVGKRLAVGDAAALEPEWIRALARRARELPQLG